MTVQYDVDNYYTASFGLKTSPTSQSFFFISSSQGAFDATGFDFINNTSASIELFNDSIIGDISNTNANQLREQNEIGQEAATLSNMFSASISTHRS